MKLKHMRILKKFSAHISQFPMDDDSSLMDLSVDNSKDKLELEENCIDENIKCEKCPGVFLTDDELKAHQQAEHVPMPHIDKVNIPKLQEEECTIVNYKCRKCSFMLSTEEELKAHSDKEHPSFSMINIKQN